jgi:hypothetical protein
MSLRRRLAEFGFEANEDYEFALRCLLETQPKGLRCLHVAGDSGRRKTAFAQALGQAWEYPHVVYVDCGRPAPPQPQIVYANPDEATPEEPESGPLTPFERAITEASAYSEADRTLLIIDQLQALDFPDQLRLFRYVQDREWTAAGATVYAHPRNLLLVLISEEALYHPLQKSSFRIWTDPGAGVVDFKPEDFGLGRDAQWLMDALARVFGALGGGPTMSEYALLMNDITHRIRTVEHLRTAIYGRIEHLQRELLQARELDPLLAEAVAEINRWVGVDEIELSSDGAGLRAEG